jgi:hypothetical protein
VIGERLGMKPAAVRTMVGLAVKAAQVARAAIEGQDSADAELCDSLR